MSLWLFTLINANGLKMHQNDGQQRRGGSDHRVPCRHSFVCGDSSIIFITKSKLPVFRFVCVGFDLMSDRLGEGSGSGGRREESNCRAPLVQVRQRQCKCIGKAVHCVCVNLCIFSSLLVYIVNVIVSALPSLLLLCYLKTKHEQCAHTSKYK